MIIFVFFVLALLLLYPCSVGWMAVPVALGRQSWWVRFGTLLGLSLIHGMVAATFFGNRSPMMGAMFFAILFLVAGSLASPGPMRVTFLVLAAITSLPMWSNPWELELEWIARGFVTVALLCGGLSIWRILGYRLVRFSQWWDDEKLATGSGYGVDEWFGILSRQSLDGDQESVVAAIRSRGVDDYWADQVADIYRQLIGRMPLPHEEGEVIQTVITSDQSWASRWLSDLPKRFRFSIVQVMIWSFCAAVLMGIARSISDVFPTNQDYQYGPTLLILLVLTTILACVAALAPTPRRRLMFLCAGCWSVCLFGLTRTAPWLSIPGTPLLFSQAIAILFGVEMFAGFCLLRMQGYRLVRVRS